MGSPFSLFCHMSDHKCLHFFIESSDNVTWVLGEKSLLSEVIVCVLKTCDDSSRVIWAKSRTEPYHGPIELSSCCHLTKADSLPGYLRLGLDHAPDPSWTTLIPIAANDGMVVDAIAFDEQTGRICVQTSMNNGPEKYLGVVDLL